MRSDLEVDVVTPRADGVLNREQRTLVILDGLAFHVGEKLEVERRDPCIDGRHRAQVSWALSAHHPARLAVRLIQVTLQALQVSQLSRLARPKAVAIDRRSDGRPSSSDATSLRVRGFRRQLASSPA